MTNGALWWVDAGGIKIDREAAVKETGGTDIDCLVAEFARGIAVCTNIIHKIVITITWSDTSIVL